MTRLRAGEGVSSTDAYKLQTLGAIDGIPERRIGMKMVVLIPLKA
jgi:hypothetical protein